MQLRRRFLGTFDYPVVAPSDPPDLENLMTDTAPRATAKKPADDEDALLAELGYTQKLDRSVGRLASFRRLMVCWRTK